MSEDNKEISSGYEDLPFLAPIFSQNSRVTRLHIKSGQLHLPAASRNSILKPIYLTPTPLLTDSTHEGLPHFLYRAQYLPGTHEVQPETKNEATNTPAENYTTIPSVNYYEASTDLDRKESGNVIQEPIVPVLPKLQTQPQGYPLNVHAETFVPTSMLLAPKQRKAKEECKFCISNKSPRSLCWSHGLKDAKGNVTCPVLRLHVCPICQATGDKAHTLKYCPLSNGAGKPDMSFFPLFGSGQVKVRNATGHAYVRKY